MCKYALHCTLVQSHNRPTGQTVATPGLLRSRARRIARSCDQSMGPATVQCPPCPPRCVTFHFSLPIYQFLFVFFSRISSHSSTARGCTHHRRTDEFRTSASTIEAAGADIRGGGRSKNEVMITNQEYRRGGRPEGGIDSSTIWGENARPVVEGKNLVLVPGRLGIHSRWK
jgi:hypothetical protein